MQTRQPFDALTSLLPSSKLLLHLARITRFVLRTPRKIFPDQLLRSVLLAVCGNTPHFRAVAEKISSFDQHEPSRQAVFARLKNEAAPEFFYQAFRQILADQYRRFAASRLAAGPHLYTGIFQRIIIEDGSVLPLHQSLVERFKGSVNQHGETAALRLRWAFDFLTGQTIDAGLHHWTENDMSTAFELIAFLKKGDLILRDMGYFCLRCFHEIAAKGAYFITRLPEGTVVADMDGERMRLPSMLRKSDGSVHEWQVRAGCSDSMKGRLVAARIDAGKANERRRKLRKSCQEQGRTPSRDQLAMCQWVVVFTNVDAEMMDAESVAQLYRARWMVEIFFKGMKSGQDLEKWSRLRTNENTIQCLAYAQMIIGLLSLNLWRLMGRMLAADGQDTSNGEPESNKPGDSPAGRTVGPIKAFELLVPLLEKSFAGTLKGRAIDAELARLGRYAAQEKRTRPTLDALIFGLLA
jgi:hypothetical protein